MNVSIVRFLGSNCDLDTKYAFEKLGCNVSFCDYKSYDLPKNTDLVVLPGGFSYGDYLRTGAIASVTNIMQGVKAFANKGGLVLGICNGFQILLEAKLLPGAMLRNKNLHFISKFTHLKVENSANAFLFKQKDGDILNIPVAHADGNYYADEKTLQELKDNNQILLSYCDENGENIDLNGSCLSIAGICNKEKNIFALMPHPERAISKDLGSKDGFDILKNLVK